MPIWKICWAQKNESLRQEEEELKKLIALQEVREIERERSKDYINRVEEFLGGDFFAPFNFLFFEQKEKSKMPNTESKKTYEKSTPKVFIRTFGWPMGAVLYDFCALFK